MKTIRSLSLILLAVLIAGSLRAQTNLPNGSTALPAVTSLIPAPSAYPAGTKVNWVRSHTLVAPVTNPASISTLTYTSDHIQTVYIDGLGRTIQSVARAEGLLIQDVVQPVYYDSFGRQPSQLLPYKVAGNTGGFQKNAFPDAYTYNSSKYPGEQAYYSATDYDDSTLYRGAKSMKPGASYAGTGHGAYSRVMLNTAAENVRMWDYTTGNLPVTTAAWDSSTLYVTEITGQDGRRMRQYKDREGKLILTKKETDPTTTAQPYQNWLCTYYLYDEMNHMRCIIPPKAVAALSGLSWAITQTMLDNLCYVYDYDERGRVTRKKLPGRADIRIIYDDADRPVLVQDGKMASANEWMFTKYDVLGRVVLSGKYINSSALAQADIALDLAAPMPNDAFLAFLKTPVYNGGFTTATTVPDAELYTISCFDSYDNTPAGMPYYDAVVQGLPGASGNITQTQSTETMGMPTGGYVQIMNGTAVTGNWESAVTYYDTHGRLIQGQDINHLGGHDTVSLRYNFSGALLSSLSSVANPACSTAAQVPLVQTLTVLSYAPNGKLYSTAQKVNDEPYLRRINTFTYDDMGRITRKALGGTAETQDYTYRVWGALEAINKAYCQGGGTNFFGESIAYDNGFDSINTSGMPSGLLWRLKGSGSTERAYGYLYDKANRLSTGYYTQNDGVTGWNNVVENYTATGMRYDENGNFTAMKQWGTKLGYGAPFEMDKLRYDYNGLSNQLKAVTDTITQDFGLGEFKEASSTATDYNYDDNGNITQDVNRDISTIFYNYQNKPVDIRFNTGNKSIRFSYDAGGTLLTKTIIEPGQATKVIAYLGGAEYTDNQLTSVAHGEGRVRPIVLTNTSTHALSTAYEYDFFIKDHAGNVRSLVTEEPDANWYDYTTDAGSGLGSLTPRSLDPTQGGLLQGFTVSEHAYVVTSELNNANNEESLFNNVDNTRDDKPGSTSNSDSKDARLNAAEGSIIGPSIMLRVMAGDKLSINTQAYYASADDTSNGSNATAAQLSDALFTALSGGGAYQTLNESGVNPRFTYNGVTGSSFLTAMENLKDENTSDGQHPQAFLNYIMLDDNLNIASDQSGFVQTTTADAWNTLQVPQMELSRSGYMLIFLSNESRINVRFDNLQITHYKGKLLEESHYYPYGLTVTTKAFSGTLGNDKLYQGKRLDKEEFSDGTGLSWYDFGARAYDPQVGVWHSYDPLGEQASGLTPYHYCNDNPVVFSDPSGMKAAPSFQLDTWTSEMMQMAHATGVSFDNLSGRGGAWGGGGSMGNHDLGGDMLSNISYDAGTGEYRRGDGQVVTLQDAIQYYGGTTLTGYFGGMTNIALINSQHKGWGYWSDIRYHVDGAAVPGNSSTPVDGFGISSHWNTLTAHEESGSVGEPGTAESLIPVWGSGRSAVNAFQTGHWGWGLFHSAMAIGDLFLVKSLATAGGKLLVAGGTKMIEKEAAAGASRAFFSGAGTEAKAIEAGYETLGQSIGGRNLAELTAEMEYYPGSQAYEMWGQLSTTWAEGASGEVHVFQNAELGVHMQSIWRVYEYPALLSNPNVTNIIFHY